ncbi:MAG: A/G-specific adenine glycosylase [Planctomycetota bacterium]
MDEATATHDPREGPSDGPSDGHLEGPLPTAWKQQLRRRLLAWYQRNARDLPWRADRDPYRVWLSEVMLQQTQVETVKPYFARFLEAFPSVADLAAAEEQQVLRLWEGLGYYRRARALHAAAKRITQEHGGVFPSDLATLRKLPGVGRYTAGAIRSIAFDLPAPILEANTIRLLTRLTAYGGDPTSTAGQKRLWAVAEELLPRRRVSQFNQALMELGALVCTPKLPRCDTCPTATLCHAKRAGSIHTLKPTTKRQSVTDVQEAAVVVWRGGRVLLRQCGEGERWAGLWDFPRFAIDSQGPLFARDEIAAKVRSMTGVDCVPGPLLRTLKHSVTRYRITLDCYEATHRAGGLRQTSKRPQRWLPPGELSTLPLSVTGRKIAASLTCG